MPWMSDYEQWLGNVRISPMLVPHDCRDGFLYAYWRGPQHIWMRVLGQALFLLGIRDAEAGFANWHETLRQANGNIAIPNYLPLRNMTQAIGWSYRLSRRRVVPTFGGSLPARERRWAQVWWREDDEADTGATLGSSACPSHGVEGEVPLDELYRNAGL